MTKRIEEYKDAPIWRLRARIKAVVRAYERDKHSLERRARARDKKLAELEAEMIHLLAVRATDLKALAREQAAELLKGDHE